MNIPFLNRLQSMTQLSVPTVNAGTRAKATATVDRIRAELPELLGVAVIDIVSGQALATYTSLPTFNPAKAASFNVEVVRQKQRALAAMSLSGEKIEDILITLREQLHLLRVSENNQHLLYLAVNSQDTNLAIARNVLRAHSN
ncbi:hypothetical protein [Hymenobacter koreensis]|uniref:Roadblock/LAMTOR2 domain-containing protein n=1 Tax=Hymenobacter koreensis TaxID=1084523 RepID=A0ABP8IYG0_9BACT